MKKSNDQHINQDSGNAEYYTPSRFLGDDYLAFKREFSQYGKVK